MAAEGANNPATSPLRSQRIWVTISGTKMAAIFRVYIYSYTAGATLLFRVSFSPLERSAVNKP